MCSSHSWGAPHTAGGLLMMLDTHKLPCASDLFFPAPFTISGKQTLSG